MINREVFVGQLRSIRWLLLVGFLVLSLLGVALVYLFDQLPRLLRYLSLPPDLEPMAQAQATNYFVYLWANWYAKHLYQGAIILALLVGTRSLAAGSAAESPCRSEGRSLGRWPLFVSNYAAGAASLALIVTGATAVTYLVSILRGRWLPAANFAMGLIPAIAGMLVIFGVAALCSAVWRTPRQAIVRATAAAALLSLPGWIREWQAFSIYRQMQAMYYPFAGTLFWGPVAGLFTAALLLVLAAGWAFARREA